MKRGILLITLTSLSFVQLHCAAVEKRKVFARLKKEIANKKASGKPLTQTEAYLSIPKNMARLKEKGDNLGIRFDDYIKPALEQERTLGSECVIFYTAVPYMEVFQDVMAALYTHASGKKLSNFYFLRYTLQDAKYDQDPTVQAFLTRQFKLNGIVDDNEGSTKTILVSTNLALFGNQSIAGESSWHYFNHPQTWARPQERFLEECLASFGFSDKKSKKHVKRIMKLVKKYRTSHGTLFQICIPYSMVNQYAYSSWRQGIPFDAKDQAAEQKSTQFVNTVLSYGGKTQIGSIVTAKDITAGIKGFTSAFKKNDQKAQQLADEMVSLAEKNGFALYPTFVDRYTKHPASLGMHDGDQYQARLVISNDGLLNPESGIQIFRYSALPDDQRAAYQRELKHILNDLMQEVPASPHPLAIAPSRQDLKEAEKLINWAKAEKARVAKHHGPLPQSLAQLTVPGVAEKVRKWSYGIAKKAPCIETAIEREVKYLDNYFVFYTAVPYMRLFQDITRILYQMTVGNKGSLQTGEFQFLRYNHNDPTYDGHSNVKDFLIDELNKNGVIDDQAAVRLKTILVSTNVAMFGNAGFTGESTWYFHNHPQPWGSVSRWFLETCLESFGFDKAEADRFLSTPLSKHGITLSPEVKLPKGITTQTCTILDLLKDSAGNLGSDLFQIFIPKDKADKIGYMCWRLGLPFDREFITEMFRVEGKLPKSGALTFGTYDNISYPTLRKVVEGFSKTYKDSEDAVQNPYKRRLERSRAASTKIGRDQGSISDQVSEAVKNLREKVLHRAFYPTLRLKQYKTRPLKMPSINYFQARLLFTNEDLLNPESGIKIFRYSEIDAEQEKTYELVLHTLIEKMIATYDTIYKKHLSVTKAEALAHTVATDDATQSVSVAAAA